MFNAVMSLAATVERARVSPFTTKSEFARFAATEVAMAACEGFISTRVEEGVFCNQWMVTQEGLAFLEDVRGAFSD